MKRNIPIEKIVAYDNSSGALDLLNQYGLKARSYDEVQKGLNRIITELGEEGYMQVATLHPDKEMILDLFTEEKKHGFCAACSMDGEKKMGCDGGCSCGGKCKDKKMSADGEGTNAPITKADLEMILSKRNSNMPDATTLLVVGGVLLVLGAVILKN